jgi:O-antigen/teichoic acid export membrane protein
MGFLRDSLVTYVSTVATFGLSALTNIIIARSLGPQGRGEVAILLLVPILLMRLGGFSLGKASIYLVGQKKVPFSSTFWACLLASLTLGGTLTLLGLIVYKSPVGEILFRGMSSREVALALCLAPLLIHADYLVDLQRAANHVVMFNWMRFQWFGLYFLLVAVLAVFFDLSTLAAIVAWGIALLLSNITGFIFLLLAEKPFLCVNVTSIAASLRAMGAYGWQIHLTLLVNFLGYRFDVFLVKGLLDSAAVGYYTVATNVAEMLWFLPDSAGVVLLPKVSQMKSEQAARFTPLVARAVLLAMIGTGFVVFLFSGPFVTLLYSAEFLPAVSPLRILLIGTVVFSLYKVLFSDLIGRGKALLATIPVAVSLIVAIGLNLVLIPRWGIHGTARAATIGYLLATSIIVVIYLRTSGVSVSGLLMGNAEDLNVYRKSLAGLSRHLSSRG